MSKKTYSIGGRTLVPAAITAGQQKLVNRLIRESVQSFSFDAQESDNPLLMYAVLWHALVETDSVARMLSYILSPEGVIWSEETAAELEGFLGAQDFEELSGLFNEAVTSFFADHPRLTSSMTLSLVSSMKNSDKLTARLRRLAEDQGKPRSTSTP